jgi:hypothetical protein
MNSSKLEADFLSIYGRDSSWFHWLVAFEIRPLIDTRIAARDTQPFCSTLQSAGRNPFYKIALEYYEQNNYWNH